MALVGHSMGGLQALPAAARRPFSAIGRPLESLAAVREAFGHPSSRRARRPPSPAGYRGAEHLRIPGTGHLVHAAAPQAWPAAVPALLDRC